MKLKITTIGNSAGVVIPKPLLSEIGAKAGDDVDISVQDGRIVIALLAKKDPREGWAEDAAALAAAGDYELVLGDFPNDFDDEEWTW